MAAKTPCVTLQALHEPGSATTIPLESPAWFAWLADEQNHSFHFIHPTGEFTARKERKQRGQWYWVAYRQVQCKLYKTYLGKTECLTEQRLCTAGAALAHACAESKTVI